MAITDRPVWGADVPISMPLSAGEAPLVQMFGFAMTQFRLVHDLSAAEYEALAVPVYEPQKPVQDVVYDDAQMDAAGVSDDGT